MATLGNANVLPIPSRVNNCRAYLNGMLLTGMVDIQLPKLEAVTDTLKGAGIAGEIEVPILGHYKAMTTTIKFHLPTTEQLIMAMPIGSTLIVRSANQSYDAMTGGLIIQPFMAAMRGTAKITDPGKVSPGESADASTELSIVYYLLTVNNQTMAEIDPINMKCVINGVDYLAAVRAAI